MNTIPATYSQCITPDTDTIRQALQRINNLKNVPLTLFIVKNQQLIGTLTDGDIRRALLAGISLDEPATAAMHRHYKAITPTTDPLDTIDQARAAGITLLPIIDHNHTLTNILDLRTKHTILPLDAILMAGGRGERLRPLTLNTPKPLLPVAGKPIIDHNIDALAACGIKNIYVTVNYLHHLIEQHFRQYQPAGTTITCVKEPRPLGTFGSIGLVKNLSAPNILIMNSDLLTDIDFEEMYRQHKKADADITIAAIPYNVSVPYAILQTNGHQCTGLQEKPTFNYLANAGVYIVKHSLLDTITGEERLDATDFIEQTLAQKNKKIITYPIKGTWIDIGSPDDYRAACQQTTK